MSWSAMLLVISPGAELSSRPAWSAAVRVPGGYFIIMVIYTPVGIGGLLQRSAASAMGILGGEVFYEKNSH